MGPRLEITVVTSMESFEHHKAAYEELLRRLPGGQGIFYSFAWLQAMLPRYCRPPRTLLFLLAFNGKDLLGVAPFFLESLPLTKGGIRRVGCWGSMEESLMVEGDFLIPNPEDVDCCLMAFNDYLFHNRQFKIDCLDLRYFRAESPSKDAMLRIFSSTFVDPEGMDSYQIRLDKSYDEYSATRSRNLIKQLGNLERALARDFGYQFEVKRTLDKVELDELAALHIRRQDALSNSGRMRASLFASRVTESCYLNLLERMSAAGLSRFYLMKVEGKVIAFIICFHFEGTLIEHLTAFDSSYSKYSPGKLLQLKVIESETLLGENRTIDLMPGTTKVKTDFCDVVHPRWRIVAVNSRNPLSRLKVAARRLVLLLVTNIRQIQRGFRR